MEVYRTGWHTPVTLEKWPVSVVKDGCALVEAVGTH